MMKKHLIIIALAAILGSVSANAQEQRVARVHYAGSVIFQTPVQTLDSINTEIDRVASKGTPDNIKLRLTMQAVVNQMVSRRR